MTLSDHLRHISHEEVHSIHLFSLGTQWQAAVRRKNKPTVTAEDESLEIALTLALQGVSNTSSKPPAQRAELERVANAVSNGKDPYHGLAADCAEQHRRVATGEVNLNVAPQRRVGKAPELATGYGSDAQIGGAGVFD